MGLHSLIGRTWLEWAFIGTRSQSQTIWIRLSGAWLSTYFRTHMISEIKISYKSKLEKIWLKLISNFNVNFRIYRNTAYKLRLNFWEWIPILCQGLPEGWRSWSDFHPCRLLWTTAKFLCTTFYCSGQNQNRGQN